VENMFDPAERGQRFRAQQAVRVRDYTDEHGLETNAHAGAGIEIVAERVTDEVE
jgi:hypothetical protein